METSFKIDIDNKKIQEEVNQIIRDKVQNVLNNRLYLLFFDPRTNGGRKHPDQDAGYMTKLVDGVITEVALDPKWVEIAKKRAEELMSSAIEEAVQRMVKNKANKIAHNLPEPSEN